MHPVIAQININKKDKHPVYLQLATQLSGFIQTGNLKKGERLPGSRALAAALRLHRKTVVNAYEELTAQGWLESRSGSGTYVTRHLPEMKPPSHTPVKKNATDKAGFVFSSPPHLETRVLKPVPLLHLDDGFPDPRIAPLADLSRAYRSQLLTGNPYMRLGYGDTKGALWLRQELSPYLNHTRGLHTTPDNILITRGTMMGLYLTCTALLQRGDHVAVGQLSWSGANMNFLQAGATLVPVPIDDHGMDVQALEKICRRKKIRLLYTTSHHNYPTTVALRAERRLQLIRLAEQYGFIIFEDDYDYDFHYAGRPLLPLAGSDSNGMVLYCGSFTKTISPALRVGYLTGPENIITQVAKLRRIIDRQGDTILENAVASMLRNGIIQRHLKKSLKVYRERRDIFCRLLTNKLPDTISFRVPDGGLSVWAQFSPRLDLKELSQRAFKKDLYITDGIGYTVDGSPVNALRLGFASSTPEELAKAVDVLVSLLKKKK